MQDDSSLDSPSRKSKADRSMALTDSFRMATSMLQGTSVSKKSQNLTIPSLRLKDKEDYKKQSQCQVCFVTFGKFGQNAQHHCRICANAVCSTCSYSTVNKQRACDICAYHYSDKQRQAFKTTTIRNLTNICIELLSNKMQAEEQLKKMEQEIIKQDDRQQQKRMAEEKARKQNQRLQQLARQKANLEAQIQQVKNR